MENVIDNVEVGHVRPSLAVVVGGVAIREAKRQREAEQLLEFYDEWWAEADRLYARVWACRRVKGGTWLRCGKVKRALPAPAPLVHRVAKELDSGTLEAERICEGFHVDPREKWASSLGQRLDVQQLGPFPMLTLHMKLSESSPYYVPPVPTVQADPTRPEPPRRPDAPVTHGQPWNAEAAKRKRLALVPAEQAPMQSANTIAKPVGQPAPIEVSTPASNNETSTYSYERQRRAREKSYRANLPYWSDRQMWHAISAVRAAPSDGHYLSCRLAAALDVTTYQALKWCERFDLYTKESEQVQPTSTLAASADCQTPGRCIRAQRCDHLSQADGKGEPHKGCLSVIRPLPRAV